MLSLTQVIKKYIPAMKFPLLSILFLQILISTGFSQETNGETQGLKKNSVYATGGIYFDEIYGNVTVNYERLIVEFPNSFFHGFQVRAGAGPWVAWLAEGINVFSVMSLLMVKGSSHVETGAGVLFTYRTDYQEWDPIVRERHLAGNIGYRYQKPGGKFLLRAGLGWPEGYYISLGFCF
jgi:hypothetical protein